MEQVVLPALPPRFESPRRVASGGMAEIYLVHDAVLGRSVALKVLADPYRADPGVRARFLREANTAARLSGHPHVVTIFDVGEIGQGPYIAMEYLPNGDLRRQLCKGTPPVEMSLRWLGEAASALDAAHAQGIVHRDVKPANLLLDARCSIRVADFGIARVTDAATTSVTMPGTVLGTAGYISPEQARGEPATGASDIYSLGAVAFEMLTGRRPFQRTAEADELAAHTSAPVPRASDTGMVSPAFDPVLTRALAKYPAVRYPTAAALVAALQQAQGALRRPVAANPLPRRGAVVTYPTNDKPKRLLAGAVAVAALLLGLAAARAMSGGHGAATPGVRTITRDHVVYRIRTVQGARVTVPSTVISTVTAPATTRTRAAPPTGGDGHALNNEGYAAMQRGDYPAALRPLEQAVSLLRGSGPADPYEAYANYNLGYTLVQLGRCRAAIPPLRRASRLESSPLVGRALTRAHACA